MVIDAESRSFEGTFATDFGITKAELDRFRRCLPQVLIVFAAFNVPLLLFVTKSARLPVAAALICACAILFGGRQLLSRTGASRRFVSSAMTAVICVMPMLAIANGRGLRYDGWYAYLFVSLALVLFFVDWRQIAFAAAIVMTYIVGTGLFGGGAIVPERFVITLFSIAVSGIALGSFAFAVRRSLDRSEAVLAVAREALAAHAIFKAVVVKGTAGIGVFAGPDGARTLAYANSVLIAQLNYEGDPLGKTALELVGPEMTKGIIARLRGELNRGERNGLDIFPWMSGDGERWFDIDAYLVDAGEGAQCLVAVTTDVTAVRNAELSSARARLAEEMNLVLEHEIAERKSAEHRLAHAAYHDVLTGLPNRVQTSERLELILRRSSRQPGRSAAVVYIDLDDFQLINVEFGRTMADLLLVAIARRFEACLRAGDVIARFGSDEFVVLLESVSLDAALSLANVLKEEIEKAVEFGERQISMSASIGVAFAADDAPTADELLRNADIAMHRAKALGKRRCELFANEMRLHTERRTRLAMDLRHAIERREFEVHYQPIVYLASGVLAGFEALVRWQHPQLGLVPPVDFIELAEETGVIVDIGAWVLRTACRRAAHWSEERPGNEALSISVNVSARQLVEPGFPDLVAEVLRESKLDASALHLEITESALVLDPLRVASELLSLRSIGVSIAMDDFGTGYSSLSYLRSFPFDKIKIDQSFVREMSTRPDCVKIVQSIAALSSSLGMTTTAEGVETLEQLRQLQAAGCDQVQGYYYGRPQPAHALLFNVPESTRALVRAA